MPWQKTKNVWVRKPAFAQAKIDWSHPLSRGLVGAWLFNEGAGATTRDITGNGNNATLLNGASWVPQGIEVNGATEEVKVAQTYGFGTSGTIIIQAKQYALNEYAGLVSSFVSGTTRAMFVELGTEGANATTAYYGYYDTSDNNSIYISVASRVAAYDEATWAITWANGSAGYFYRNGVLIGSDTTVGGTLRVSNILMFGTDREYSGRHLNGVLKNAVAYNRALSGAEILYHHTNPYSYLLPVRTRTHFVASGGAETQDESYSATGGAIAGGSATVTASPTFAGAGGSIAGGAATITAFAVLAGAGGSVAGGAATVIATATFTGSSGAIAGGAATATAAATNPGAGGAVAGGAATITATATQAGAGGAIAGGLCAVTASVVHTASGGAVAGGEATVDATQAGSYSYTGTGGAVGGGSATATCTVVCAAVGGAVAGGGATVEPDYFGQDESYSAAGGAVAGGTATVLCSVTFDMAGGGVASGAATVTSTDTSTVVRSAQRRAILGIPPAPTGDVDLEDRSTWLSLYEFGEDEAEPAVTTRPYHEIRFLLADEVEIKFKMPVDA